MTKYDIKCARRSLAETDDVISPENTTLATNYSVHKGHTFTVARSIYTPAHKSLTIRKKRDKNKSDNEITRGERERKKFSRQNVQSSLMVLNVTKRPLRKQPNATSSQCCITLCRAFYSMWGHIWPYYTVAPFDNWWKNNQWPCTWTKAYCRQYYLAYWWLSRHWKIMFFFSATRVKYPFVRVHESDYYSHVTFLCNSLKMFQVVTSTRVRTLRMFSVMALAIKMKYKVITGFPDTNFILAFPCVLPDLLLASSNLSDTIILFISFGHADRDNRYLKHRVGC